MVSQSEHIAWLGVGKMGMPISTRIAAAGYRVTAFDVSAERMAAARDHGLAVATSATEAVTGKSVVFTSLPDDSAARDLLLTKGLLGAMAPRSILIETSTVSAEISAEVATAANEHKIDYLRLPVSGNSSLATTGALTCFVSGPKAAFEHVKPLLASFTRAQTYLGKAEQARYAKLAVNLMIAVSAGMMAESLALARKGGIEWQDILKVLDDSAVASPMVKYKTPPLAKRDFSSTFSCRQMAKDLDLILGAGHSAGVPLQLASQLRETYSSLIAQGDGEADYIATVLHLERLSGLGKPKM
jgi:3-hydroxyisobutyrate dehydrogenase-like beta-hydroxyacid dehydrogenase